MTDPDIKRFGFATAEEVLDTCLNPDNNLEFVRIIFPDILGRHMDFSIPVYELSKAFDSGKGFDGSSVEGFVRIEESDLVIKPDPATFRVLPWDYRGFEGKTVWRERIGGHYYASPVLAEGRIYFCNDKGATTVVRAGRTFTVEAVNRLDDGCMASPCIVGRSLILRTKTHLYRIED